MYIDVDLVNFQFLVKVVTSIVLIGSSIFSSFFSCVEFLQSLRSALFVLHLFLLPVRFFIEVHVLTKICDSVIL